MTKQLEKTPHKLGPWPGRTVRQDGCHEAQRQHLRLQAAGCGCLIARLHNAGKELKPCGAAQQGAQLGAQ